jgi:hypothetical protein
MHHLRKLFTDSHTCQCEENLKLWKVSQVLPATYKPEGIQLVFHSQIPSNADYVVNNSK